MTRRSLHRCVVCRHAMTLHRNRVCQGCTPVRDYDEDVRDDSRSYAAREHNDNGAQAYSLYDSSASWPGRKIEKGFRMLEGLTA